MNRRTVFWISVIALVCSTGLLKAQAPVGTAFTYQGQLKEDGIPAVGAYDFRFWLYDAAVGGNLIGGPIDAADWAVEQGLFTVQLDFGSVFNGQERWLLIGVRPDDSAGDFTLLSPLQLLTVAPYAAYALQGGTATNADTLDGQHGSFYQNASNLNAGTLPDARLSSNVALLNTVQTFTANKFFSSRVGIGTSSPSTPLDVIASNELAAIINRSDVADNTTVDVMDLRAGTTGTPLPGFGGRLTWRLVASNGGSASVGTIDAVWIDPNIATAKADMLFKTRGGGNVFERLRITGDGDVGIGTTNPAARLDVTSSDSSYPTIYSTHTATTNDQPAILGEHAVTDNYGVGVKGVGGYRGVEGRVSSTGSGTYTSLYGYVTGGTGSNRGLYAYASGTGASNYGVYGYATGAATTNYGVYGYAGGATTNWAGYFSGDVRVTGELGIGSTPEVKLHVTGGTDASLAGGGYIVAGTTTSTNIVIDNNEIMARNNGATSTLYLNNDGGDVQVPVLVITGGSDLAEKFDVTEETKPGMVVAIDPANPGKLCISRGAYNRRVAGVISGANDVTAGMILADLPGAKNSQPVALTGRVWTFCDASERSVEPGDLLTTADRPGYAMPVSDHARAQGAVIGKAMTALAKGETGMVLVLVNLQ
ncbi:MAG: hypothetical protein JXQ75_14940 [Phycisphaerae bacterium]|nr:hypothetical protein [Phycisphaerae bacterium]